MSGLTGGRVTAAPALLDRYLRRHTGRTRENLHGHLCRWVAWCGSRAIDWPTATADDALAWAAELRDAGRSTRTVATLLSALRGLYRWARGTALLPLALSGSLPTLDPSCYLADQIHHVMGALFLS